MSSQTLTLVIPAYNETARLPALLEVLADSAASAIASGGMELVEALIVDDGSTDGSREMMKTAAEGVDLVRPVLDLVHNSGKGAAFRTGVMQARGDYVLMADVDLSTPLDEFPKLTAALDRGADLAIGSRAIEGAVVERGPAHRKFLGKAFNGTVRALTGLGVHDTQNGFKLIPTAAAQRLVAEQLCPGFAFDVEVLMRADRAGLRIAEVPVVYMHDHRSSVQVLPASLRMLREISALSYRLRARRRTRGGSPDLAPLAGLPANDSDRDADREPDALRD